MDPDLLQRVRILRVPAPLLKDMLRGDLHLHMEPPLPEDAYILSIRDDWDANAIALKIQSRTFDRVPEGIIPPDYEVDTAMSVMLCPGREVR